MEQGWSKTPVFTAYMPSKALPYITIGKDSHIRRYFCVCDRCLDFLGKLKILHKEECCTLCATTFNIRKTGFWRKPNGSWIPTVFVRLDLM